MSDSTLDSDELEAIQASLRSTSTPRRTGAAAIPNEADATPMTLIASERDARSARPRLLGLATPWIRQLDRSLKIYLTNEIRIELVGAEIIDGRSLRDELRTSWTAAIRPPGKLGAMLVTVGGPVVEVAAARRCGSQDVSSVNDSREPSPVALKLFEPAGRAVVQSLSRAWKERENADIIEVPSAPTIAELLNSDIVICMTLAVAAPCGGRIRLFSTPTTAAAALSPRPLLSPPLGRTATTPAMMPAVPKGGLLSLIPRVRAAVDAAAGASAKPKVEEKAEQK